MAAESQTIIYTIRLFGATGEEVARILRQAARDGCPGLRLLSKNGEFAVQIQMEGKGDPQKETILRHWVKVLIQQFGDNVYGTGDTTLAKASLDALIKNGHRVAAADVVTGRMLAKAWEEMPQARNVFDFGKDSYDNPDVSAKMVPAQGLRYKYPGDPLQETASLADVTRKLTGADYAIAYTPHEVGYSPFVLISTVRACWACPIPAGLNQGSVANYLLDVLRRMSLSKRPLLGTVMMSPGGVGPELGQPALDTTIPPIEKPGEQPKPPVRVMNPGPEAPGEDTLEFLLSWDPEQFLYGDKKAGTPAPAAPRETETIPPVTRREEVPRPPVREEPPVEEPEEEELPPNSLDEITETVRLALEQKDLEEAERRAQAGRHLEEAARAMYGGEEDESLFEGQSEELEQLKKRRRESRRGRGGLTLFVCVLVLIGCAAAFVTGFMKQRQVEPPEARGYGTVDFDQQAQSYLDQAMSRQEGVSGYLAWPGQDGVLITQGEDGSMELSAQAEEYALTDTLDWKGYNTVLRQDSLAQSLAGLEQEDTFLDNTGFTFYTGDEIYRYKIMGVFRLDEQEEGQTAFPLDTYTDLVNYLDYLEFVLEVKIRSLYNVPLEVGETDSFLTMLAPAGEDTLAVVARLVGEGEDQSLVPSAIETNEGALWPAKYYETPDQALEVWQAGYDTWSAWYLEMSQEKTTEEPGRDNTSTGYQEDELEQSIDEMEQTTQDLLNSTDQLIKDLLAQMDDVKGSANESESNINQGAEGNLPDSGVSVDDIINGGSSGGSSGAATPAPTTPSEGGDGGQGGDTTNPTPAPTPAPVNDTITVTMNGSVTTMDLVECLAMVARNELGPNAPDEAYKAQMVATHCWILSQGAAPSVAGMTPTDHLRDLAREVAHVLITYNGQVCFTPYFASASTGTASSADIWGGERAWLQAVDSPYDKTYASNWNTNGNSSGTARYSRQVLQDRILEKLGIDLSSLDPSQWFTILKTNAYGWIGQDGIQIGQGSNSTTCSGRWFRETLTAGRSIDGRSLRSSCFTVQYDAATDTFIFDVYGYGHGCGLSQWGAIGYASNGWNYQQILTHYYTGVTLITY